MPARRFVLQNPSQIEKQVIPAGTTDAPAIKVGYYAWGKEEHELKKALASIQASAEDGTASVLLLGRYRFVKPDRFADLRSTYPGLSIRFMTVHGSKGLEADHVIILRASNNRMGFPSQIVDDPLLDLVLPEPENYDHAEERRLFYVALTRARKSVTILADRQKPSVFARELVDHPAYDVIPLGTSDLTSHKCSACGGRMLAQTSKKGSPYFACEHWRLCGAMMKPCIACGNDLPEPDRANADQKVCSCGAVYPSCPECADGWLVERKGRYGEFLGCVNYPFCKGKKKLSKMASKA